VPNAARSGFSGGPVDVRDGASAPVDLVFGADGALYYAAISTGEVRRVRAQRGATSLVSAGLLAPLDAPA